MFKFVFAEIVPHRLGDTYVAPYVGEVRLAVEDQKALDAIARKGMEAAKGAFQAAIATWEGTEIAKRWRRLQADADAIAENAQRLAEALRGSERRWEQAMEDGHNPVTFEAKRNAAAAELEIVRARRTKVESLLASAKEEAEQSLLAALTAKRAEVLSQMRLAWDRAGAALVKAIAGPLAELHSAQVAMLACQQSQHTDVVSHFFHTVVPERVVMPVFPAQQERHFSEASGSPC